MKFFAIFIGCGVLLLSGSAFADGYRDDFQRSTCFLYAKCQCVDPTCFRADSCISKRTCCKAFGNIGAIN